MQSQNKGKIFSIIHEYRNLLKKAGLKTAPEKTFFCIKKVLLPSILGTRHFIWTNTTNCKTG